MPGTADIKAIVVDLDKTLLRSDKTLSPDTVRVLEACRQRGMKVMVATARPLRTTTPFCKLVDFDALVVSNGARVICGDRRTDHAIRPESAVKLLHALLQRQDLRVTLETGDCAYSNLPIDEYDTVLTDDLPGVAAEQGALKIQVHLSHRDTEPFVRHALPEGVYATVAHGTLMQVMSAEATKWNGVKAMLDLCNCPSAETAYFGDDNDDIEPIKMCGLGVAVANAIDEVKAIADGITESNDADGVAKYIERMLQAGNETLTDVVPT